MSDALLITRLFNGLQWAITPPAAGAVLRSQVRPEPAGEDAAEDARSRRALILDLWDAGPAAFEAEDARRYMMACYSRRM